MYVSLTSAFIPSLQIHFQKIQNLFTVSFTKLLLYENFEFSIHCQVEVLVEICYVWKDPTSKILFSVNTFSMSFVTHSLKTFIISNASCTSYACPFSTCRWISYDVFVLIFMLVGLIFRDKKLEPSLGKARE